MARDRGLRARGRRRRGGHDARRPPARALRRPPDPAVPVAAHDDPGRPRGRRPGHPGPSARPLPALRPGLGAPPAARRSRSGRPPRRRSRRSIRRRSASRGIAASSASPTSTAWPTSATATPTPSRRSAAAGRRSRAATPRICGAAIEARHDRARRHVPRRRPASSGTFGQQLRKRGRDARDEVARPGPARRDRAATTATRAAVSGRHASSAGDRRPRRGPMKIGLVCPYIYPEPGGVAQHVRLPLREPPPARPRRPDHHRQPRPAARVRGRRHPHRGSGFSVPAQRLGGDAHVLAALPQPGPRRCSSASGSTSSTSTSRSCRSCRSSCCASRTA